MKREDLLEAIGKVDESLLAESERLHLVRHTSVWVKAVVAAAIVAIMSVTALAATKLLSRPVEGGGIVTEGTISPVTFVDGDIYRGSVDGLKVVMETEVDEGAPRYLEEIYRLKLSDEWTEEFRGGGGNGFEYSDYKVVWTKADTPGEVRFRQRVIGWYGNGSEDDKVVDLLHELPLDTAVTTQVVTLADREMLQICIPAVDIDGYVDQNVAYYRHGEYRLYWTDGRYLFQLDYPSWVTQSEAEQMLGTLYAESFVPDYPEGWGEIDAERIVQLGLSFRENGNGTTLQNINNAATGALYAEGCFIFGDPGAVRMYDTKSGETAVWKTWENSLPRGMLLMEEHICFEDSKLPRWGRYCMDLDGQAVEPLFEGVHLGGMWAEGNVLYGTDQEHRLLRVDLTTGSLEIVAENVNRYYMDDTYLYILPWDGEYFLRGEKETGEFERFALTFCPISMVQDGDVLYFTIGGQMKTGQRRYQVVRWINGQEEKLSVYGTRLQIIGGKLLYDADPDSELIEMYDLETGQIDLLQKDVFDYLVFEDRYVVFNYLNDGWGILDWDSGEMTKIEEYNN